MSLCLFITAAIKLKYIFDWNVFIPPVAGATDGGEVVQQVEANAAVVVSLQTLGAAADPASVLRWGPQQEAAAAAASGRSRAGRCREEPAAQ